LSSPTDRTGRRAAYARQVFVIVRRIPRGRVTTYGWIAAAIAAPRGIDPIAYQRIRARWVGYALAAAPDGIPWQRVVNAAGRISPRPGFAVAEHKARLRLERVRFARDGAIDLDKYGWRPR
jgi:methylated-DNA-protein-cysteine methyltransferase-like protein